MNTPTKERSTRTKEAVEHVLMAYASPVSLNDLYQFIKTSLPKTAFSTVFRIVRRLEEEGKIIRIDWRERGSRYEWADLPHHHHIVCQICGNVTDIDDTVLNFDENTVKKHTGYTIQRHSIELEGVCPDCQKKMTSA
jgi:Fe2+ or Zn2+ uptake regulation protein